MGKNGNIDFGFGGGDEITRQIAMGKLVEDKGIQRVDDLIFL